MTNLNGTNLAAGIVTFTTEDTYPTHFDTLGKGGYRSVLTIAERDSIPAARRTAGMLVYVKEDNTEYRLKDDNTWEIKPAGVESDPIYTADKPNLALKSEIPDISVKADKSTTYTKTEVDNKISSIPVPDVSGQISTHDTSGTAHTDIRELINGKEPANSNIQAHISSTLNPHSTTAEQIGAYNKTQIDTLLNEKVNTNGYVATENNYTTIEKNKLATIESGAQVNPDLSTYAKMADVNAALALKADKTEIGSSIQIVRL